MNPSWRLTDHACASCFGRVLVSSRGAVIYRCANCGSEEPGRQGMEHPPICACGMKAGGSAGFRCVVNEPTPACPSEIVVREV